MLAIVMTSLLLQAATAGPQASAAAPVAATASATQPPATPKAPDKAGTAATADPDLEKQLVNVKRIYVDSFGDDAVAKQI